MPLSPDLSLVTGATGFVGSAVARALLRAGHKVRVLARPNSDRRNLADLSVEIAEGSMEDFPSLVRAVAGCRFVYHVAADYRIWVPDPVPMFRANVEGTRDLLTAALEAFRCGALQHFDTGVAARQEDLLHPPLDGLDLEQPPLVPILGWERDDADPFRRLLCALHLVYPER